MCVTTLGCRLCNIYMYIVSLKTLWTGSRYLTCTSIKNIWKIISVLTELMQVSGLTFYHVNRTTCNSKKASSRFPWVRGQLNCHIRARGGKRSRNGASTELLAEGPIGDPDVVSTMNFKRIEYQCDCLSIFWLQFPGLQHLHANWKYERWHNKFTVPN